MSEYAFKMTPSLLDAFQAYLDCEANYEKFFGHSEEPSLTYAEYEDLYRDAMAEAGLPLEKQPEPKKAAE